MWVSKKEWKELQDKVEMCLCEIGIISQNQLELEEKINPFCRAANVQGTDIISLRARLNALCDWLGVEWAQENFEGFRKKEGS